MDPARMFKESLTPRPELENSQGQRRRSARAPQELGYGPQADINEMYRLFRSGVRHC
ncbi:hypothetical protein ABIF63_003015 [Bradyrhizobium japonicum]|uniref:Transposase n=1 Tax=Bradyrhizobium japonicum TaxID=375 RepID=A0ABV2RPS4_BRAJP